MASPFSLFRRHQKVLMVLLTGLAMFAFIIMGSLSASSDSQMMMPLMMGGLFAVLFWVFGKKSKNRKVLPVWGFIVGITVFIVPAIMNSGQGNIQTNYGEITPRELFEMRQNRDTVNRFIALVFDKREEPSQRGAARQFMFASSDDQQLYVDAFVLRAKADEMNVQIGDDRVSGFIRQVAGGTLSRGDFVDIRTQMGLGESQLFDLVRDELKATVTGRILSPSFVYMPEQYYRDFEKANRQNQIDFTAFPVDQFAAEEPEPTDVEIKELFELGKARQTVNVETPGFLQPSRAAIGWLKASYAQVKANIDEPSEETLLAKYEEIKEEKYKIEPLIDLPFENDPTTPGSKPNGSAPVAPPLPDEGTDKGSVKPPSLKLPELDKEGDTKPTEPKPADTKPTETKPAEPKPADAKPTETKPAEPKPADAKAAETKPADAKPADAKPAPGCDEQPDTKDETSEKTDKQPEPKSDDTDDKQPEPQSDDKQPEPNGDGKEPEVVEEKKPEPTYESFDDVREQVLDLVVEELVQEAIKEKIDVAVDAINAKRNELRDLSKLDVTKFEDRDEYTSKLNAEIAPALIEFAERYAKDNDSIVYHQTFGQVGGFELVEFDADRFFDVMLTYDTDKNGDKVFDDKDDIPGFVLRQLTAERSFQEAMRQAMESIKIEPKPPETKSNDTKPAAAKPTDGECDEPKADEPKGDEPKGDKTKAAPADVKEPAKGAVGPPVFQLPPDADNKAPQTIEDDKGDKQADTKEDTPVGFKPQKKNDTESVVYHNFDVLDRNENGTLDEAEYLTVKLIRAVGERVAKEYKDLAGAQQDSDSNPAPVTNLVFNDLSPQTMHIASTASGETGEDSYSCAFWTIDAVLAHQPTLDELSMRRLVAVAHKRIKAREKVEARSQTVLKIVKAEKQEMDAKQKVEPSLIEPTLGDFMGRETLTGSKDSIKLSSRDSSTRFSWLNLQQGGFMQPPSLRLNTVDGITMAGDEFMRGVDKMDVDELAVIPNADQSVYYLIHLVKRAKIRTIQPQMFAGPSGRPQIIPTNENEDEFQTRFVGAIARAYGPPPNQFTQQAERGYLGLMQQKQNNMMYVWQQRFRVENGVNIPTAPVVSQ